jgi:predicted adenine nucleotide alpha hydrolase (AANH) superfamily ATPase
VIPLLQRKYRVISLFFNPNIHPEEEYILRLEEMKNVSEHFGAEIVIPEYRPELWDRAVEGYRELPEKSVRCWECYRMRLEETARRASELGAGWFTTTLSVSPHKIYREIVRSAEKAAEIHGVRFHHEDFKKKDGFRISVEKSRELSLTRQDYCGCILSLREAEKRRNSRH